MKIGVSEIMVKVKTIFGKEVDCIVNVGMYTKGGVMVRLSTAYEPYATLTTKLDVAGFSDEYAFVDTNNCPWAEELIKEYNLGKPTGMSARSGYCTYPLYKFNFDELEKHKYFPDDYVPQPYEDDDMPF